MSELSKHGKQRCSQRGVSLKHLDFLKKHGQKYYRTGIEIYFLGKKNIPKKLRSDDRYAKLEGTILMIGADGGIITVYRNRKALKDIRKKNKHRLPAFKGISPLY